MKKFRKLIAGITAISLSACMMFGLSAFAAADDDASSTSYSITIHNETSGYTYVAYQIFNGSLTESGVLSNIKWGTNVDTEEKVDEKTLIEAIQAIEIDGDKPFEDCETAEAVAEVLAQCENNNDDDVAKAFATAVEPYIIGNGATINYDENDKCYNVNIEEAGYYLVKNTEVPTDGSYTRYILQVVGEAVVEPKSDIPNVMKKVEENTKTIDGDIDANFSAVTKINGGTATKYNDVADYNIGEVIPFRLYGSMPSNIDDYKAYRYIFHDTLNSQFDLVDFTIDDDIATAGVTVSINDIEVDGSCYTVTVKDNGDGNHTITIEFKDILSAKNAEGKEAIDITASSVVTVDYSAKLNTNANIGLDGQENEVYLEYSNNPNWDGTGKDKEYDEDDESKDKDDTTGETEEDKVIVFTYELDLTKVDATAWEAYQNDFSSEKGDFADYGGYVKHYLQNAKFLLYTGKDEIGNGVGLVNVYESNNGYYCVCESNDADGWTSANTVSNPLKTDNNGSIKIKGLDDGTYYLEETEAPEGYNKLTGLVELRLTATTANNQSWGFEADDALTKLELNNEEQDTEKHGIANAIIENKSGSILPSTGSIGTTIFYVSGGILVIGAGVTLITKKRMKNEQ